MQQEQGNKPLAAGQKVQMIVSVFVCEKAIRARVWAHY